MSEDASMQIGPFASRDHLWAEIERLRNELAKAQFQPNNRKLTREIIRSLILEIKTLRLELRQAQVMQVKSDQQTGS